MIKLLPIILQIVQFIISTIQNRKRIQDEQKINENPSGAFIDHFGGVRQEPLQRDETHTGKRNDESG